MWEVPRSVGTRERPDVHGKDCSDVHGCTNAAGAGMRRSGLTILLHSHHCTWTCRCREAQDVRERPSMAVRCTSAAKRRRPTGMSEVTTPGKEEVDRVGNSGREQRRSSCRSSYRVAGTAIEERPPSPPYLKTEDTGRKFCTSQL